MGYQVWFSNEYSWLWMDMYGYALNKFWWQAHINDESLMERELRYPSN